MNNKEALNQIYKALYQREQYGTIGHLREDHPDGPGTYFSPTLYPIIKTPSNPTPAYIGWTHYGSSANKPTKKDLAWIIKNIFDTTPSEFLNRYITRTEYNATHTS